MVFAEPNIVNIDIRTLMLKLENTTATVSISPPPVPADDLHGGVQLGQGRQTRARSRTSLCTVALQHSTRAQHTRQTLHLELQPPTIKDTFSVASLALARTPGDEAEGCSARLATGLAGAVLALTSLEAAPGTFSFLASVAALMPTSVETGLASVALALSSIWSSVAGCWGRPGGCWGGAGGCWGEDGG